jgi:hypothetical protein
MIGWTCPFGMVSSDFFALSEKLSNTPNEFFLSELVLQLYLLISMKSLLFMSSVLITVLSLRAGRPKDDCDNGKRREFDMLFFDSS